MRTAIFLALTLCGCSTVIRDPKTGVEVFRTYADAKNVRYENGKFHADVLNHSTPMRAAGSVLGTGLAGAAPIITGVLAK